MSCLPILFVGLADLSFLCSNGEGVRGYVEELCELVMYVSVEGLSRNLAGLDISLSPTAPTLSAPSIAANPRLQEALKAPPPTSLRS